MLPSRVDPQNLQKHIGKSIFWPLGLELASKMAARWSKPCPRPTPKKYKNTWESQYFEPPGFKLPSITLQVSSTYLHKGSKMRPAKLKNRPAKPNILEMTQKLSQDATSYPSNCSDVAHTGPPKAAHTGLTHGKGMRKQISRSPQKRSRRL